MIVVAKYGINNYSLVQHMLLDTCFSLRTIQNICIEDNLFHNFNIKKLLTIFRISNFLIETECITPCFYIDCK